MANLTRGAIVDLRFDLDVEASTIDELEIVLVQNGAIVKTWTLTDATVDDATITVTADQATTLALATNTRAMVQLRARINGDVNVCSVNTVTVLPWLGASTALTVGSEEGGVNRKTIVFSAGVLSEEAETALLNEIMEELDGIRELTDEEIEEILV